MLPAIAALVLALPPLPPPAPDLSDLWRFPDEHAVAVRLYALVYERARIQWRIRFDRRRAEHWQRILRKNERQLEAWESLCDATDSDLGYAERLQALSELQRELGSAAWLAGRMP